MKPELNKDGIIYKAMNKHRLKNVRYCVTLIVILVAYFLAFKPYITNVLFGASPLDEARFKKDAVIKKLEIQKNADDEIAQNINSRVLKGNSYWQDDVYEFSVNLNGVKETGVNYTTKNTKEGGTDSEGELSAIVYVAEINGVDTIVLSYPHQEIKDGTVIDGIFAPIPPVVSYDLINKGEFAEKPFYKYMLDTRGLEMEDEGFDIIVCAILLLVIAFLIVKIVIQFMNPLSTPTYKKLSDYGDVKTVSDDVEDQLKKAGITSVKRKRPAITTDWIVTEEPFKLNVAKNHAKPQDSSRYGSRL